MKKQNLKEKILYILDVIRTGLIKLLSSRMAILFTVFIILFAIIGGRLFYLQIVMADYYTENFTQRSEKTITSAAARGNIYDCNGNLLAYNVLTYSVSLTDEIPSSDTRGDTLNGIIDTAVKIIEENGDEIINDFNVELDSDGEYSFKEEPVTSQTTFLVNIFGVTSSELKEEGYDQYTADEIMEYLIDRYGISEEYTKEETLKIATIRYTLSLTSYQKYVSVEIANDVSDETKAAILEASDELTGVDITESYTRVYNDAIYFAHIIGYTGEISESELEEYNLENDAGITYEAGDIVGKAGVEKTYDSYLQGTKGTETVFVDSTGNILDVIDETQSEGGNDLYLTIDRDLQIVAYTILEKQIASALRDKIVNYDYVYSSSSDDSTIYIPVKDVYSQFLTNIADFTKFLDDDASEREKSIGTAFEERLAEVVEYIIETLNDENAVSVGELSDEYNEYMYLVYDILGDEGILDKSLIDTDNDVYTEWANESCSLREFLQEAIAQNWISTSQMTSEDRYLDSDAIYDEIVNSIEELITEDRDFAELIYYYMIYNEDISAYDICMILYDQGILEEDDLYEQLSNKVISTYQYVLTAIEELIITPDMIALDPCSGALCITDVDTGEVKALVSYPSYDNNLLSGTVDSDYWYELNISDSQPLYDYATQALTAPGSTFKLCTAVAALSEDYITPSTTVYDEVTFELISPSPACWSTYGHGTVNLAQALSVSCNYFFYQIGYNMSLDENGEYNSADGLEILEEYAIQLGLGISSGIEIDESSPSISTTDSVRSAIGQGTNAYSVVQMARYVNTIAGSGYNYALTLIDRVEDKDGNVIVDNEPELTNVVELEDEEWDAIHYGMRLVTTSGTASSLFTELETVTIAGKTGTAQEDLTRSNHTTFVGYAPYDDPEISIACTIRNSGSTSYPCTTVETILRYYYGEITYEEAMSITVDEETAEVHTE